MNDHEPVHELFLNYACNAKCAFCYNPEITDELLRREMTFQQAAESLYAAAARGIKAVNMHGGEVTLRDDLPQVLRLSRKLGFGRVTLVTNGIRLASAAYARRLVRAGLTHARLSVHGPDAATHDAILEVPGAFERSLKALANFRALEVPVGVNFVLERRNLERLPEFVRRFCVRERVGDVIVYFPHERGLMALNAGRIGVRYSEAAPWLARAARALSEAKRRDAMALANFVPCVAPAQRGRMLDWSRHAPGESTMTHPEGFTGDVGAMKGGQRAFGAGCASCSLRSACLGVEREYLARWGDSEFRPVRAGRRTGA